MAKHDKELRLINQGRISGLEMALRLVEKGGIEALKRELHLRGRSGINTGLTNEELDVACDGIKKMTNDTYLTMCVWTLHNEPFRWGEKRIQRFVDRFEDHTSCLIGNFMEWPDITAQIKEELNLDLEIRYR